MLALRSDQQKESIPAHGGADRTSALLFEAMFPGFQGVQDSIIDCQMVAIHGLT